MSTLFLSLLVCSFSAAASALGPGSQLKMPETQMEAAFSYIQEEFCKYGEKVDGQCLLTKAQVNKLLHEQMPSLFKVPKNPNAMEATTQENVDKMWKEMDDIGRLSLDEFMSEVGKILMKQYRE